MVKIGVVYPQTELNGDPRGIVEIGRATEALGYDHLLMYDHVIGAARVDRDPPLWMNGPYTEKDPFHDPLVAFGYLAGITQRIKLVTGILVLPQRQTALVAKQATDIDLLSGGRLRLGVGPGWNYVEYDTLGQNFHTRGERLSEQIGYLRRLWTEPVLSFQGKFDQIDRAGLTPRPSRPIPIYCGGFVDAAYRRAAKLADGFIFAGDQLETSLEGWNRVQQLLAENGRAVTGFRAHFNMHGTAAATIEKTLETIERWRDAGGTHCSIVTMWRGYRSIQEHVDHLAELSSRLKLT